MFRIETYQDPHQYFPQINMDEDSLHVTGDSSFRLFLMECHPSFPSDQVVTYEKLQKELFPKWNGVFSDLYLKTKLREEIIDLTVEKPLLQRSLIDSIEEWLDCVRFLVDMGLLEGVAPPEEDRSDEQVLFYEVWKRLLADARCKRLFFSRQGPKIDKTLAHVYRKKIKRIYVYHMIQMSADRMRFFLQCVQARVQVVFRIPYYSALPHVYQPWKAVYQYISDDKGWLETGDRDIPVTGRRFASYLEGDRSFANGEETRKVPFYEFVSPVHFQRALHSEPSLVGERRYIVDQSKTINQMFRGHMGTKQLDDQRPYLLQLPCNRFFLHFYQCQNRKGTIWLEYRDLMECITSGWVVTREVNGKEAASFLLDLEPYMEGIQTIEDVLERIDRLEELREISGYFDDLSLEKTGKSATKQYLSNPFRAFSYVNQHRYNITLKQLRSLLLQFQKLALSLLPEENEVVSINKHLHMVFQLWERVKVQLSLDSVDQQRMEKALQKKILEPWNASRAELFEFMATLLTGKNQVKDQPLEEDIDNLNQLEGLALQTNEIHVTGLSTEILANYSIGKRIAPLTFTWLKHWGLADSQRGGASFQDVVIALRVHYELNHVGISFLYFQIYYLLAFAKKEVIFSWIKEIAPYDEKSALFELLHVLYGEDQEIEIWTDPDFSEDSLWFDENEPMDHSKPDFSSLIGQIPSVSWLDQDFCSRKFYYNTIVSSHPIYETDFHQRIAFSIIGDLFAQQALGEEGVVEHLFPLFPQWNPTLKKNFLDTVYKLKFLTYRTFQNISHPKGMNRLQRLYSQYIVTRRYKVKTAYDANKSDEKRWLKEWGETLDEVNAKAEPGKHCMMCPHLMICEKGEFAVDHRYSS